MKHHHSSYLHTIRAVVAVFGAILLAPAAAAAADAQFTTGSFASDISTSVPASLAPASGATFAYPTSPITLSWSPVAGASSYELQIARVNVAGDCSTSFNAQLIAYDDATLTRTAWVPSLVDADDGGAAPAATGPVDNNIGTSSTKAFFSSGTYCWHVRAKSGGINGVWSSTSTFIRAWGAQVVASSMKFYNDDSVIPRPAEGASDSLTHLNGYLSWDPVAGATGYDVEVSPQANFAASSIMLYSYNRSASRIVLPHLPDDTYYWRVRSNDARGNKGSWVTGPQFQIAWTTMTSVAAAAASQNTVYPPYNAAMGDVAVGWKPVPGAAKYEVQVGTTQSCFAEDSTRLNIWGLWVTEQRAQSPLDCRVTNPKTYTVNNWLTKADIMASDVTASIDNARTQGIDIYTPLMASSFYWRVRPIFEFRSQTETSWDVSGTISIKGRWLEYTGGGSSQPFTFTNNASLADSGGATTDCPYSIGALSGSDCVVQKPSLMEPTNGAGSNSTDMQVPNLRWKRWNGYDEYIVQLATDENFDHIALDTVARGVNYTPTFSFADNALTAGGGETGYWWRAVPCKRTFSQSGVGPCQPVYYPAAAGLYNPSHGESGARSFTKDVSIQPSISPNFANSTPLLSWTPVQGTSYYEVQLSSDPFFGGSNGGTCGTGSSTDTVGFQRTGIPRLIPTTTNPTDANSRLDIADGTWYWRVRACDSSDETGRSEPVATGWSDLQSFVKQSPPPVQTGPASGTVTSTPVLSWNTLQGALAYEVQWDDDPSFSSPEPKQVTYQTSFQLPAPAGKWFWRVRGLSSNATPGTWTAVSTSSGPFVQVVAEDALSYAVAHPTIIAGTKAYIDGRLDVDGEPSSGRTMILQRKTAGCASSGGTYIAIASARTGETGDDGTVRFGTRLGQNACFRLLWNDGLTAKYSAPIAIGAQPKTSLKLSKLKFRRNAAITATARTNVAVSGRVRLQYRVGTTWYTAKTVRITRRTKFAMRVAISRSGTFQTRLLLDSMGSLADTTIAGPKIRVNDVYSVTH